jgi:hypothetical protein
MFRRSAVDVSSKEVHYFRANAGSGTQQSFVL